MTAYQGLRTFLIYAKPRVWRAAPVARVQALSEADALRRVSRNNGDFVAELLVEARAPCPRCGNLYDHRYPCV